MAGLYRDRGIVLRSIKLGEADRIVTFLTEGRGKVRAVAKGIRRPKSRCSMPRRTGTENPAYYQAFSLIGETGFEPATARPPAGAIRFCQAVCGGIERSELL